MSMIFVKPASGGRVRMPERGSNVMKPEGEWVPDNAFYQRLLVSGDVIRIVPEKPRRKHADRATHATE